MLMMETPIGNGVYCAYIDEQGNRVEEKLKASDVDKIIEGWKPKVPHIELLIWDITGGLHGATPSEWFINYVKMFPVIFKTEGDFTDERYVLVKIVILDILINGPLLVDFEVDSKIDFLKVLKSLMSKELNNVETMRVLGYNENIFANWRFKTIWPIDARRTFMIGNMKTGERYQKTAFLAFHFNEPQVISINELLIEYTIKHHNIKMKDLKLAFGTTSRKKTIKAINSLYSVKLMPSQSVDYPQDVAVITKDTTRPAYGIKDEDDYLITVLEDLSQTTNDVSDLEVGTKVVKPTRLLDPTTMIHMFCLIHLIQFWKNDKKTSMSPKRIKRFKNYEYETKKQLHWFKSYFVSVETITSIEDLFNLGDEDER